MWEKQAIQRAKRQTNFRASETVKLYTTVFEISLFEAGV